MLKANGYKKKFSRERQREPHTHLQQLHHQNCRSCSFLYINRFLWALRRPSCLLKDRPLSHPCPFLHTLTPCTFSMIPVFLIAFHIFFFLKNLNRKLSARRGYTQMEGNPPAQFFLFGFSLGSNQHSSITCLIVMYTLYCLRSSFSSLSQNKQLRLGEQKWSDTAFSTAKRIDVYQLLLLFHCIFTYHGILFNLWFDIVSSGKL